MKRYHTFGALILSCLAAAPTCMPRALNAADGPDAIMKLLGDAQAQAAQLSLEWKSDARRPAINWASDAGEAARMNGEVIAVVRTAGALDEARGQSSPAQLATMDRIVPLMQEIADNTANAIDFLAKNQTRLTGKQYKDYVEQSSDTSNRLAVLVSQLVDYESRKARLDLAKRNLELAAK
jgi:hypothetical protein